MIVSTPSVGDVGLVTIPGFWGWLIGKGQRLNGSPKKFCRYEHVFVVTDDSIEGNPLCLEALPGGADSFNAGSRYAPGEVLWLWVAELTADQKTELVRVCVGLEGVGYSFLDYVALLAHRLHLPVPGLKKYIGSTDHEICSQLIALVFLRLNIHLFDNTWPGYVTPADYRVKYGDSPSDTA